MKIALITIHNANNYGALLQAYATQQAFSKYGETIILDYDNRHLASSFNVIRCSLSVHGLKMLIHDVLRLPSRVRALRNYKKYIADNLVLSQRLTSESLKKLDASKYDYFVSGSDQIWNPDIVGGTSEIDENYFLGFVSDKEKKISYASSKGAYPYSGQQTKDVVKMLSEYKKISVRESDAKAWIEENMEVAVEHVLDPTLLLTAEEWGEAGGEKEEPYILLYSVPRSPLIKAAVDYYAEKLSMRVVSIDQNLMPFGKVDVKVSDAGPSEYIQLFKNADYVITDSFHGVCFSLIFSKVFFAIHSGGKANRMESLLSLVGLSERIFKSANQFSMADLVIDYGPVREKISYLREQSLAFIRFSLGIKE